MHFKEAYTNKVSYRFILNRLSNMFRNSLEIYYVNYREISIVVQSNLFDLKLLHIQRTKVIARAGGGIVP